MHYTSVLLDVLIRTRCSFVTCWKCQLLISHSHISFSKLPSIKGTHLIIQGYSHCPRADYTKCLVNAKYYLKKKEKEKVAPASVCDNSQDLSQLQGFLQDYLKLLLQFHHCGISTSIKFGFLYFLKGFLPEGTPHTNLHLRYISRKLTLRWWVPEMALGSRLSQDLPLSQHNFHLRNCWAC